MASATPAIRTPAPSSDGAEDDVGLGVDPRPPDGDRLAAFAPTPPSPKGPESFHAAGLAADLRDSPPVGFELTHRAPLADEPATPQPDRTAELTAIEVVAAMFQSLLPDERVPAVLRILFARLQLPVIRVAVAEPWRFAQADHPARRLIDRLGSCALDLRAGDTAAEESLAIELRRIVEVVEAYPDAGRRAFEVVLQEFDRFQAGNLAAGHALADHGLPLTQRVAQRETMVVQCTIELRRMVDGVPVHDGVHRFLFQTWAHVLAAVRAADTGRGTGDRVRALKRVAAELIWVAGAKRSRLERARVLHRLPRLRSALRDGMNLAGLDRSRQDAALEDLNRALAAGLAAVAGQPEQGWLMTLTRQLASMEEALAQSGGQALDDARVRAIGAESSLELEVIRQVGPAASDAIRAWARELPVGAWFMMTGPDRSEPLQLAWHGTKRQMALLVGLHGRALLFPDESLAGFLEAGRLRPAQEESMTLRSTRDLLASLAPPP